MHGKSGKQECLDSLVRFQEIRRDASVEQPFLIALTASHGAAVEVATKAVGFDAYVRKPADTTLLIALVNDLAGRSWNA